MRRRARIRYLLERESWWGSYGSRGKTTDINTPHPNAKWNTLDDPNEPSMNRTRTLVNYATSRLMSELPAIEVHTLGGSFEEQQRSRALRLGLNGTLNSPEKASEVRRWGAIGMEEGFAAILPEVIDGDVRLTPLRYEQVFWDPHDAREKRPQSLHVCRRWQKSDLIAYIRSADEGYFSGDRAEMIQQISRMPGAADYGPDISDSWYSDPYENAIQGASMSSPPDQVWVIQSWRVPGGKGSPEYTGWSKNKEILDSGRYAITVHGGRSSGEPDSGISMCLHDGPWTRMTHPVVVWSPFPHTKGLDGAAYTDLLIPYQRTLDIAWDRANTNLTVYGQTRLLYPESISDQKPSMVDPCLTMIGMPDSMFRGGPAYHVITPQTVSPQDVQFVEQARSYMAEDAGLNPSGPSGQTRLGANASGVALLEEDSKQDVAMAAVEWQFDQAMLRLGGEMIYALGDAADQFSGFRVSFRDELGRQNTKLWKDVVKGLPEFGLELEPTGFLGKTLAGRINKAVALRNEGIIPPEIAADAVSRSPDISSMLNVANSGRDLVKWQLAHLSDDRVKDYGPYQPDETTPLEVGIELGMAQLRLAKRDDASMDTLNRLNTYILACKDRLNQRAAQASQSMPAPAPTTPRSPQMGPGIEDPMPAGGMPAGMDAPMLPL